MKKNLKAYFPFLLSIIVISFMVGLSEAFNQKELIFPEIAALSIGCLITPNQPWKVSKIKLFFSITINAFLGILIVSYIHLPLWLNITLGFIISIVMLCFMKITFYPIISAIILPIILGTTTVVYPIAASTLTGIIIILQLLLEKYMGKEKQHDTIADIHFRADILLWLKRLLIVSICAVICTRLDLIFLIAPPLIVAFTELSSPHSKARNKPVKTVLFVCSGAIVGSLTRYYLSIKLSLPLYICTIIIFIALFFVAKKTNIYFPPAGAIATLSMLVDNSVVLIYPCEIIIGFSALTLFSLLFFTSLNNYRVIAHNSYIFFKKEVLTIMSKKNKSRNATDYMGKSKLRRNAEENDSTNNRSQSQDCMKGSENCK